jgi:hypothetical protein
MCGTRDEPCCNLAGSSETCHFLSEQNSNLSDGAVASEKQLAKALRHHQALGSPFDGTLIGDMSLDTSPAEASWAKGLGARSAANPTNMTP